MGFEELGKKLIRLGQDTKTGVQKMSESYQITGKINEEKKTLDNLYEEIGRKLYALNAKTPLEGLEEEFEAIRMSLENIQEYNDQLQQVKGVAVCPECGKEAAKGEKFCSSCGARLPEVSEEIKEDIKDAAGAAANTAGELVEDVIDKAKALAKGLSSKIAPKDDAVADAQVYEEGMYEYAEGPTEAAGAEASAETAEEAAAEETTAGAADAQENVSEAGETPAGTAGNVGTAAEETAAENVGAAEEETTAAENAGQAADETAAAENVGEAIEETAAAENVSEEAETDETAKANETQSL
ncbi:MAG: zinc ribbon domain-containing protein [Lachnospiraceae bacterium]|nr:zinc ribbon domain-containing protein [Lachnospiraceae bacterium]